MQLGFAFWGSRTFLAAVEMGLFTALAKRGPMTVSDVEKEFKLHPRSSRDFLDTLVALGMLARDGDQYSNTPEGAAFLDKAKPAYIGGILEMCSARLYPFWDQLPEALRDGKPKNEAARGGDDFFGNLYADPKRLELFLASMTGLSMGSALAIAQKFDFSPYKTCIDIGCAQGCISVQVALAHKHITGGGFDLPVVQPIFERYVQKFDLQSRLKFFPGNFMNDPLPKADVLVMGHILHDWNLEEKQMLLKKAYEALPSGGALIVHESLIDDERKKNAFGLLMSLNMLIETPGGFDYTGADAAQWMKAAGFKDVRVKHLVGPDSMVIAAK
jgi:precorrin-6B methylase 2